MVMRLNCALQKGIAAALLRNCSPASQDVVVEAATVALEGV